MIYVFMSTVMFQQLLFTFTISVYRFVFIIFREANTKTNKRKQLVTLVIFAGKWILLFVISAKFIIFNEKYQFVKFYTSVCNGEILRQGVTENTNLTTTDYFKSTVAYQLSKEDESLVTIFGNVEDPVLSGSLKAFCIVTDIIVVFTCVNLAEGILYYRISKYTEG